MDSPFKAYTIPYEFVPCNKREGIYCSFFYPVWLWIGD